MRDHDLSGKCRGKSRQIQGSLALGLSLLDSLRRTLKKPRFVSALHNQ